MRSKQRIIISHSFKTYAQTSQSTKAVVGILHTLTNKFNWYYCIFIPADLLHRGSRAADLWPKRPFSVYAPRRAEAIKHGRSLHYDSRFRQTFTKTGRGGGSKYGLRRPDGGRSPALNGCRLSAFLPGFASGDMQTYDNRNVRICNLPVLRSGRIAERKGVACTHRGRTGQYLLTNGPVGCGASTPFPRERARKKLQFATRERGGRCLPDAPAHARSRPRARTPRPESAGRRGTGRDGGVARCVAFAASQFIRLRGAETKKGLSPVFPPGTQYFKCGGGGGEPVSADRYMCSTLKEATILCFTGGNGDLPVEALVLSAWLFG